MPDAAKHDQKKAVVTGASSGIGQALAFRLAKDGYAVTTMQRRHADIPADLRRYDRLPELWQAALLKTGGTPDLVILNAGTSVDGNFVDATTDMIEEVLALNLIASLVLAREVINTWLDRRSRGHLIFIGSQAALPGAKQSGNVLYTASKGAIHSVIGPLATEYGPHVRVNCIAPGDVRTEAELDLLRAKSKLMNQSLEMLETRLVAEAALKRWVTPDEIYDGVAFLERCGAVTGATLNISAGKSAH